jgi:putative ABC transport system permease protein
VSDVRYAFRLLCREPGYAAVAILTIALGIGATTTLFSVAYGVLLKPLPYPDAGRIVRVTETRNGREARLRGTISNGPYLAWRDSASTVVVGGYSVVANAMTALPKQGVEPVRLKVGRLTSSMFDVLQTHPIRGRAFVPDDERVRASGPCPTANVIILSYALWQDWFGGRDEAIGTTIRVDEASVTVVGVMPRGFAFADAEIRAWLPMPIGPVNGIDANGRPFQSMMIFGAVARLKAGFTVAQAGAEGTARARTAPDPGYSAVAMFGSGAPPDIVVTSAAAAMTADVRPAILLLFAAVVLLLATATANVGSLQLARATTRRRELAVRAAIGAAGGRLVRQLMVESAVIGLSGGGAGIALTFVLDTLLPSMLPADFPRVGDIAISLPVLLFAVTVSIVTSVACGLLPALSATRGDLANALAQEGVGAAAGAWRTSSARVRTTIMAGQIAVASVLLVGAALLGRSFVALLHADRGYDPTNVLTARLDLPRRYDGPARVTLCETVLARMREVPGVTAAATANALPFLTLGDTWGSSMPSPANPAIKQQVQANFHIVSPDYFRALRLRLVEGRLLSDSDALTSPPVLLADLAFARKYLGDVRVGAHIPIKFGDGRPEPVIVGIVADMHQGQITEPQTPELFMSFRQLGTWMKAPTGSAIFIIRTADAPVAHIAELRTAVREQDPSVALDSVMTMEERVATSLAKPRLYAMLLVALGVAALAIAGVGLFGVLSYAVAQRAREIGIRTALGAQVRDIFTLVLRQAVAMSIVGIGVGLTAAAALTRYVSSLLFGVSRTDAFTYAAVSVVVAVVAATACFVPACRAARIDPLIALKTD